MARMYAKVRGQSLNEAFTKSGDRFKRNKNIPVDIDINRLANLVYREVMKKMNNENESSQNMDESDLDSPEKKKAKEHNKWKLSIVGGTMLASQIVASSTSMSIASASNDNAQVAQTAYTNTKGTASLLLSTFGGPYGMILAVILNRLDGIVGQYVKNQIQLQYDNARLDYNLTTMNIGRNSTYTYDYEQNKWVARDVQRVKNNILNQTTSV
jgi:hypothetical protein